ncbi:unnamed protein product, partial [Timema podura]|nr:unnamed protein product [Timema podura]
VGDCSTRATDQADRFSSDQGSPARGSRCCGRRSAHVYGNAWRTEDKQQDGHIHHAGSVQR